MNKNIAKAVPVEIKKQCNKCYEVKAVSQFFKDKKFKDGLWKFCKICATKQARAWQANNKDRIIEVKKQWRIKNKEKANASSRQWYYDNKEKAYKQHLNFIKNNPGYYQTEEMKEKKRASGREWFRENKEHRNQVARDYYYNNKNKFKEAIYRRKAKIKNNGGTFTWDEFLNLCKQYQNTCLACGKSNIKLTPDHVVALFNGGLNSITNIQPLCLTCNISKGIKTIDYRGGQYARA